MITWYMVYYDEILSPVCWKVSFALTHGWLTHIWRCFSGMIISLGKNVLMLQRIWRLGYLCAYATTVGWRLKTQLLYLSAVLGSIQISQKEAEHYLFLTKDQIWLNIEDGIEYADFLKQSRVYTRVHAHKTAYVWLLTILCLESALFSTAAVLFGISGISGGVLVLLILFLMFW